MITVLRTGAQEGWLSWAASAPEALALGQPSREGKLELPERRLCPQGSAFCCFYPSVCFEGVGWGGAESGPMESLC